MNILGELKSEKNKGVYIQSMQASDIWEHNNRNRWIKSEYTGMIPHSLELIKLKSEEEFDTYPSKRSPGKEFSNDLINVKFSQVVRSGKKVVEFKQSMIDELGEKDKLTKDEETYISSLKKDIKNINSEMKYITSLKWKAIGKKELRSRLYEKGFTIIKTDPQTGEEIFREEYKFYKRSSSKSRKGECLFIKKSLHGKMEKWSRMGLDLDDGMKIDLPGLLSYESLVGSSIESTLHIKPENILLIKPEYSSFKEMCDVIYKNGNKLDLKTKNHPINNEIWDGQALLDSGSDYFAEGQSFKLLRNHFFKAAAFSTHIQEFFRGYAKKHEKDYENWKVKDMFGDEIKVTDIKLIINPSCLKIFRFAHVMNGETELEKKKNIYELWKTAVEKDGNVWGVCKHDKPSKYEPDKQGNVHVTSYQMLNSLSANYDKMKEISQKTLDYIKLLQTDLDAFKRYIEKNKNDINSNQMWLDLLNINKNIAKTKVFRDFRSKTISNYKKYIKRGKLMLNGDYCTIISNPYEYLLKAAGEQINNVSRTLEPNEIHTSLFGKEGFNEEYIAFRSPHGSMANTLKLENVKNNLIEEYFDFSPNIVAISSIKHNWMERANGADMDGDTLVLFRSPELLNIVSKTHKYFKVVVNNVPADDKPYVLSESNAADIDHTLSESKDEIGKVTNLGMLALSLYHHKRRKDGIKDTDKYMIDLMKNVKIMGVLAGLSIDSAKRKYKVNVKDEIKRVKKEIELLTDIVEVENKKGEIVERTVKHHPNFWNFVSESDKLYHTEYKCPMDQLLKVLNKEVKNAPRTTDPVKLENLLVPKNNKAADRKQRGKAKGLSEDMQHEIECTQQEYFRLNKNGKKDDEELHIKLESLTDEYGARFNKLKVNENTMYSILKFISTNTEYKSEKGDKKVGKNGFVRLMNELYKSEKNKETFLNAFIKL